MYLSAFRLENQVRFRDTGILPIGARRTAIVGANNSGKTALLRSLSPDFRLSPSRTSEDSPFDLSTRSAVIERRYLVKNSKIIDIFKLHSKIGILSRDSDEELIVRLLNKYKEQHLTLCLMSQGSDAASGLEVGFGEFGYPRHGSGLSAWGYSFSKVDNKLLPLHTTISGPLLHEILTSMANTSYHRYGAERLAIDASKAEQLSALRPDCGNLPAYLDHIQPNPEWVALEEQIKAILPSVTRVSVRPNPQNGEIREIVIWTSVRPRGDLAIPLSQAGTGVGQVLAILSVVLTSLEPKLLLIDEPNSFLHPGAAKKLLSTFAEDRKHQYVITTHSLETLRWFDPEVVLLLKPNGDLTDIEVHSWRDLLRSRVFMSELGISYGDVTGADHCVWVEGQTEAEVFPRIARRLLGSRGGTIAFPRVSSTGHFERRARLSKEELLDIYRNVTETVTLIPDTLAFLFDREARSERDVADLEREMKGKIAFLPRYCFENYLLDAEIIAEALKDQTGLAETAFDAAKIEAWWAEHAIEAAYWPKDTRPKPITDDTWRADINAAKLLSEMVDSLSGGKAQYRKTVDSVAIAKLLLDHKPDSFREIADIILGFLPKAASS